MSTTPPLECQLPRVNKFVGEVFGEFSNSRTIYAGSEEDTVKRDTRVILLIGPCAAAKSSLIDFFCNYFYGAELDQTTRYHIADEKFDNTTPEKEIIAYIFNDSMMDVRPVLIDTPPTSGPHCEDHRENLSQWLKENENLEVDVIGVVFSVFHRITSAEEEGLQKALELFPPHIQQKCVVFMVGSDGSSPPVGLLRRFNLERADVYKVNTTCIFQRAEDDPLQEHLRGNYWRMSLANFSALFSRLKYDRPVTNSSGPRHIASSAILTNSGTSSVSSRNSLDTIIRRAPGLSATEPHISTMTTANRSYATNLNTSQKDTPPRDLNKAVVEPEYERYSESTRPIERTHMTSALEQIYIVPEVPSIRNTGSNRGPAAMSTSSELNTDISRDITHGVSTTSASTKSGENTVLLSKGLGRILNNTSTDDTLKPHDGGVTRYVYDISTRTHMLYHSDPITYQKSIGDSSRTARETTINDPYYDVFGSRKETLTSTRHSWHEILPVHRTDITTNESQRRKIPVETLIDFRSPVEHSKEFEYCGSFRNNRHVSESRSRSVEPQFVAHPAQAGHTVSTGNILPDINDRFGRKTYNGAVDVRKSPVFSLGSRENSQGPPLYTSSTSGSFLERERAVKPHVPDYKNSGRAPLPSYPAVVRARSREPNDSERSVDTGELEMRRGEEMSNEYLVKAKSDAGQIPYRDSRSQRQANTTSFIRQYDQPPLEHTDRNAQIISRANPTLTQMNEKLQAETSYSNSPNSATDYSNDWGDKTPVIRGTNEDQPLPQFPLRQNRHYPGEVEMEPTQGKLASSPLSPYAYRPTLPPPQPSPEQILRGDVECGGGETRLLKDAQAPKAKTKKMLTSTASTTHHRPRHISFLKWTPANCSNPRDCCLNCLFFFIAPLVLLFIILAIIITLVVG